MRRQRLRPNRLFRTESPPGTAGFFIVSLTGSEFFPVLALPISTPFMLTPGAMFGFFPLPVIGMDLQPQIGAVGVFGLGVPTVAVLIADNARRRRGGSIANALAPTSAAMVTLLRVFMLNSFVACDLTET
jgi:hypothetical protein